MARTRPRLGTEVQRIIREHSGHRRKLRAHLAIEVSGNLLSRMQLSKAQREQARRIIAHEIRIWDAQHQIQASDAIKILRRGIRQLSGLIARRKAAGKSRAGDLEMTLSILQKTLGQFAQLPPNKQVQLEPNLVNKLAIYNEIALMRALGKNYEKYDDRAYKIRRILSE